MGSALYWVGADVHGPRYGWSMRQASAMLLVPDKYDSEDKLRKWERILGVDIPINLFLVRFTNIYKVTNHNKLRSFQYRLLQHAIITNRVLKIWNILDDDACTLCNKTMETITHLLWECEKVRQLWESITDIVNIYCEAEAEYNLQKIMFNEIHSNPRHKANFVCLAAKVYIYKIRSTKGKISINEFTKDIEECESIEKQNALKSNRYHKH